jgi:hypothetical protein
MATAETVVPPGNSAATQYTEGFPTSGGNAQANSGINGGHTTPAKVLGTHNASKLESKGQVGQEVADLAAETAPQQVVDTGAQSHSGAKHHGGGAAGGGGSGNGSNGGGSGGEPGKSTGNGSPAATHTATPSGSSGLGEVLAQATGSSSGQLGLFLPLLIIATVAWSLHYLWRQRRPVG